MSNEWLLLPDRRCRTLSTLEGLRIDFEADRQDVGIGNFRAPGRETRAPRDRRTLGAAATDAPLGSAPASS
jgi:hypothetical protein